MILAVPGLIALTTPCELTVTIFLFEDEYVTLSLLVTGVTTTEGDSFTGVALVIVRFLTVTATLSVLTVSLCTVTLKAAFFLLARITVTVAFPVLLPAVSLKVPLRFTDDTFTMLVLVEVTFVT